jgi:FkbM family methyltransferase
MDLGIKNFDFNKIYQKIIVKNNLEGTLHFFYTIYLLLVNLTNIVCYYSNIKKSFSSFNQDTWIAKNIFKNKSKGVFIDVGSYDGLSNNNTILFEKFYKWKGHCIEPNLDAFNVLKKYRKSILVNAIISNSNKKYYSFWENNQLSRAYDKNNIFFKNKNINNLSKVKNFKLAKFQKKYVDLISIDCEGFEEKVIKSINFKKKIGCIIIERPNKNVHHILKKNKMIYVKRFLFDYIYINKLIFKESFKEVKYNSMPTRLI